MKLEDIKIYGTGWAEFTQLPEAHYMVVLPWAVKAKTVCAYITETYWCLRDPGDKPKCEKCQATITSLEKS